MIDNPVPMTLTGIVAVVLPTLAVTVIVRLVGSPASVSVAVAAPFASVTPPLVTVSPPDVEVNCTVAPLTKLLLASRTSAVIVAGFEPSEGICGELVGCKSNGLLRIGDGNRRRV